MTTVSQQNTKNIYDIPTVINDTVPSFDDITWQDQIDFALYNEDAPLLEAGQTCYCIDDFTGKRFEAIYLGWYADFDRNGETSPYFSEAYGYEEIHRVVVRRFDGGKDYILPENCLSEAQVSKNWAITVKVSDDS